MYREIWKYLDSKGRNSPRHLRCTSFAKSTGEYDEWTSDLGGPSVAAMDEADGYGVVFELAALHTAGNSDGPVDE